MRKIKDKTRGFGNKRKIFPEKNLNSVNFYKGRLCCTQFAFLFSLLFLNLHEAAAKTNTENIRILLEPKCLGSTKKLAAGIGKVDFIDGKNVVTPSSAPSIVAGRLDSPLVSELLVDNALSDTDRQWLGEQGFHIRSLGANQIVVTANTHAGVHYGMDELSERLKAKGLRIFTEKLDIKDRPVFLYRTGVGRGNFKTLWSEEHLSRDMQPFYYKDFPEIFPDETTRKKHWKKVDKWRAKLKKDIKACHDEGAKAYLFIYLPALPGSQLPDSWAVKSFLKAHPELKPKRKSEYWHPFMCPSQPLAKQLMNSKLKELFTDCSDLDGIILNFGENGQSIVSCGCEKCKAQSYETRLIEYAKLMIDAMQKGNPKAKLLLRPWGITRGPQRGTLDSTAFKGLADKLPEDVMFIGRLTSPPTFDSSWQERYTPILGMKRFLTWKWHGYHPNSSIPWRTHLLYDGPKYKQRAMTLADLGQLGLANGGYQNNDPCTELSMLAAKKIAWDPYRFDPTAYLSEWAEKKFGAKAGKHVTNALKDSWKVIDAFVFFERPTQTCHIMNFVPRQNSGFYRIGCVGKQPAAVANVTQKTLPDLLKRFDIKEAVDIAQSAEVELDKAHELRPNDKYLKKLWMLGKATPGLAKFWRGHHLSIIYNNMSAQSKGKEKKRYSELARSYSQESMEGAKKYLHWLYELYPLTKKAFDMGNGVVGWKGAFTPPSGPTICTPTFYAHGRMASVFHQAQNGYNRLVMEDRRKKHHPYLLWQLNNTQPKIDFKNGAKLSVPLRWVNLLPALQKKWGRPKYDIDLDQTSSSELPTLISPYIMPSLNIQFSGNLKDGGMLALKHRPLGGWETPRDAEFDIAVDGKKIGVIHDLACRDAIRFPEVDFIRYLEIPPLNGTRHKLTISASRGYGSELYFLRLYTPVKETRYPTAGIEPNPFMTNSPPSGRKAIRLEAEKFKTRNKVSTIDNPNASGGKMILFKKRDSFLESEITLDPGTYYLNIRGLADNSDEDGFSCLIAGEKMNLYFQDYKILTDSGITPFSVRKGGTQKIRIVPRDIRFKIDFVEIR